MANANCSEYFYCYCPAGYVFSSDVTQCLSESAYGVACKDPVQCSHMVSYRKLDSLVKRTYEL